MQPAPYHTARESIAPGEQNNKKYEKGILILVLGKDAGRLCSL